MKNTRHPLRYRQQNKSDHTRTSLAKRVLRLISYTGFALLAASIVAVVLLRFLPAPTSAFMLHRHLDDLIAHKAYHTINQTWVDKQHISRYALSAVIAAEDQRFHQHHGFDIDAIFKAYQHYQQGGKLRGASTISQQVAKNLFLSPAKNMGRKILEIWFTFLIESFWSKARILEMYLNIAEFGDHLFGIEAASQHYFGIPAKHLSPNQAALLAATLPNPILLKAAHPSPYLLRRQAWILRQMHNLGD